MSCCEDCVVRLTQLVGMGLRHGHASKEPGDRDRWAPRSAHSSPPCHHLDGLYAGCGLVVLVQLCFQFQD